MADNKPLSRLTRDELEKLAKKEKVEVTDEMTVPDLRDAIRAKRGEGDDEGDEAAGADVDEGELPEGEMRRGEGQTPEPPGEGDQTMPQDEKAIPTSTDAERLARSGGDQAGLVGPSGEGKEKPESEIPPTSGPEDVFHSGVDLAGTGGVTATSGGGEVKPATRLADGGPQPPQPTGADTAAEPLEQTAAAGSFASVATANGEENIRRIQEFDGGKERAAAAKRVERESGRRAELEEEEFNPSLQFSAPLAVNTLLTITARNFPPRVPVRVKLSHSRTPSGLTMLRSDPQGTVQVSIFPVPGKQSVAFEADKASVSAEFEVADLPNRDRDRDREAEEEE